MKVSIGIDPGTTMGFAVTNGIVIYGSGSYNSAGPKGCHEGVRWKNLEEKIREIINVAVQLDDHTEISDITVYYEDVKHHDGVFAAHAYGGCKAILQRQCLFYNIDCIGLSVGRIKKFATNKGNCKKEMMMASAEKRWPGIPIQDDNHADALWIAAYGHKIGEQ